MVIDTIPFSDFKSDVKAEYKIVKIKDKEVKVLQYLPVNQKLELITRVLQLTAGNEYNFVNPVQLDVYTTIEVVKAYSNIDLSAEGSDVPGLYDALEASDVINGVISAIPPAEYKFVIQGVEDTVAAYYQYQNSALGILENISKDYSNLNLEAEDIQKKIGDPDNLNLLKDVLTKLG